MPPSIDAYSASVGTRPANTIAARRRVLRHDSIPTPSNRFATVTAEPSSTSSPSSDRNRSIAAYSSVPDATWMPPPCDTPWILFSTYSASSSASRLSNAERFFARCSSSSSVANTSRVLPDTPPSTWQATHFDCTIGEISVRNTSSAVSAPPPGAVDRFVRCPVGLDSRLITATGASDSTASDHLPVPSPSAPAKPSPPVSSSCAVSVRDDPAGTVSATTLPGDAPASSVPATATSAGSVPAFTMRSRLRWLALLPGLNTATRCVPSTSGATSCIAVRNPSVVRMYDRTWRSSALDSARRQSPSPAPVLPDRPLPAAPASRSSELKCLVSFAPIDSVTTG